MRPDGMHQELLKELANVTVRPHSVILESPGQLGGNLEESKCHSYLEEGGPKELQASKPHLFSWDRDGVNNHGNHFQKYEG